MSLPPLRKRAGDIQHLTRYFLDVYRKLHNKHTEISPPAYDALTCYDWPGNVRELRFFIERIVVTAKESLITENRMQKFLYDTDYEPAEPSLADSGSFLTKDKITATLEQTNSNVKEAAQALGISRSTLYRKLKAYKIEAKKAY